MHRAKKQEGFTLFELILAVFIIAAVAIAFSPQLRVDRQAEFDILADKTAEAASEAQRSFMDAHGRFVSCKSVPICGAKIGEYLEDPLYGAVSLEISTHEDPDGHPCYTILAHHEEGTGRVAKIVGCRSKTR